MALDFIAGCLGGCAGVAIGHPFDTVKVKLQTQNCRHPVYRGTWDCFTKILQAESLVGLYRGVWSPMCGVALVNAVVFGVYGNIQRNLAEGDTLAGQFVAGAAAGLAQSVVSSPVELVKTRMQTSTSYSGTLDCLTNIIRSKGIPGVFKGLTITGPRDFFGYGLYFASYEFLTKTSPGEAPVGTPTMLLAGGISGTISWVLTYPLDVIKTRFQADKGVYSGLLDCLKKSVESEGLSCLSRGLTPTLIRAFPTNAVTFTVVTWVMRSVHEFNVIDIADSLFDKLPKEKHLITADLKESVRICNVNWPFKMNTQRYFLIAEDLWVDDEIGDELSNTNYNTDKNHSTSNGLEYDLQAAEQKMLNDLDLEFKQNEVDVYQKILQRREDYKSDKR